MGAGKRGEGFRQQPAPYATRRAPALISQGKHAAEITNTVSHFDRGGGVCLLRTAPSRSSASPALYT